MAMRHALVIGWIGGLAWAACAVGQEPGAVAPVPAQAAPAQKPPDPAAQQSLQDALERTSRELKAIKDDNARELERQRKQAELQQRQIEVLERTMRLLVDQIKKQAPAGPAVESLESKTSALEARSQQAANRDRELADANNELRERFDAQARRGPALPYTARELFLPTQTNETPLSIYGQILGGYSKINGQSGLFQSPSFSPFILLQLNQKFLMEVSFDVGTAGFGMRQAQMDWFVKDWLTVSAGRFLTPIGSFNERLYREWINKLPDIPLMFRQVVPLTSTDGLQLRGSRYLGGLPLKLEYSIYAGNGFQLSQKPPPVGDLQRLTGGPDQVSSTAYGGRIGLWVPRHGINFGLSGYTNGIYSPGSQNHYFLGDVDFNYHRGNWDFRAEFANNHQEATSFQAHNINRLGMYAQVAYRDYQSEHPFLQRLEYVYRYGYANFNGIKTSALNPTLYATPFDVPVSRDQHTLGINYYFYPSMALKLAYEINRERGVNFHDDIFLAQGVWAF
jgi:hypothetical protein